MTSGWRSTPDFLVLGSQKSGTTSLFTWLGRHPSVVPPTAKEIEFFDRHYSSGFRWYRAHFPAMRELRRESAGGMRRITGEATPDYLMNPLVPPRVHEGTPHIRLIALLRDPADRAHSFYNHRRRRGIEPLGFDEAVEAELELLEDAPDPLMPVPGSESSIYRDRSYVRGGLYAEQLERWFAYFPRDQFLIIRSEDLFADASPIFHQVLDFLQLPQVWEPRSYRKINPGEYERMDPENRRRLNEFFRPHNRRLEQLLGRSLGWDA